MTVKLILQGGPFDSREQIVLDLNTTPGFKMQFNIPNYQTFAPDGETVLAQGLSTVYAMLQQGPAPGGSDTWTTSWVYEFTGESFIPPPPPITPPVVPPGPGPAIWMGALSGMTVNADDPSPGVQLVGEGDMVVDATTTSVDYATVGLLAETFMSITLEAQSNVVTLVGESAMTVTPN